MDTGGAERRTSAGGGGAERRSPAWSAGVRQACSTAGRGVIVLIAAVWPAACRPAAPGPAATPGGAADPPDAAWFVDGAAAAGLDFVHFNGMTGKFYSPEMTGPGAGLFDYDNDGDLDVYLVQGDLLGDAARRCSRHPRISRRATGCTATTSRSRRTESAGSASPT